MLLKLSIKPVLFAANKFLIFLVSSVFNIIGICYNLFDMLVHFNLFNADNYNNMVQKVYILMGVIMLFVISYNVLTFIVDPDKNKNGQSVEKLLKNLFSSVILIILCPFIFSFAARVQNVIVDNGTIAKFFTNTNLYENSGGDVQSQLHSGAKEMEFETFNSFFYGSFGVSDENIKIEGNNLIVNGKEIDISDMKDGSNWKLDIEGNKLVLDCDTSCTFKEAKEFAKNADTYIPYQYFATGLVEDKMEFHALLALVAGAYLVFVMVSFTFDIAERIVKLFFYEICAPICIAFRVVPNKDDVFKNWFKAIKNTYLSVFIRLFIMSFGVWIIAQFSSVFPKAFESSGITIPTGGVLTLFAKAFVIMGIVTFIKDGPKYITGLFGFDDINMGLGSIKEKFKKGGGYAAAGAISAGAKGMVRSFNRKDSYGAKRGIFMRLGSALTGAVSGTLRGGYNAKGAGSFKDVANARKKTIEDMDGRYKKRMDAWRAGGRKIFGTSTTSDGKRVFTGVLGNMANSLVQGWQTFAGTNNVDELERQSKIAQQMQGKYKGIKNDGMSIIESFAQKGEQNTLGVDQSLTFDGSSFGNTGGPIHFNTQTLKQMQDALYDINPADGKVRAGNRFAGMTQAQLQNMMNKYKNDYAKEVVDIALSDEAEWNRKIKAGDIDEKAAMAYISARDKALDFKNYTKENLSSQNVFASNVMAMEDALLDVTSTDLGNDRTLYNNKYLLDSEGNIAKSSTSVKNSSGQKVDIDLEASSSNIRKLNASIKEAYRTNGPVEFMGNMLTGEALNQIKSKFNSDMMKITGKDANGQFHFKEDGSFEIYNASNNSYQTDLRDADDLENTLLDVSSTNLAGGLTQYNNRVLRDGIGNVISSVINANDSTGNNIVLNLEASSTNFRQLNRAIEEARRNGTSAEFMGSMFSETDLNQIKTALNNDIMTTVANNPIRFSEDAGFTIYDSNTNEEVTTYLQNIYTNVKDDVQLINNESLIKGTSSKNGSAYSKIADAADTVVGANQEVIVPIRTTQTEQEKKDNNK